MFQTLSSARLVMTYQSRLNLDPFSSTRLNGDTGLRGTDQIPQRLLEIIQTLEKRIYLP
jgi:hypothetical protein